MKRYPGAGLRANRYNPLIILNLMVLSCLLASCAGSQTSNPNAESLHLEKMESSPLRSPAARAQGCQELMNSIWRRSGESSSSPDPLASLTQRLDLEEGAIDRFIRSPAPSERQLSRLFSQQVASKLPVEQKRYAAGLTMLIQKRHPDLAPRQVLKRYNRLMRSCINS